MNYEVFKETMIKEFQAYLPEAFRNWKPEIDRVNKVNLQEEALHLMPEGSDCITPTLYLHKFYRQCEDGMPFETVMIDAAAEFMAGMEYLARVGASLNFKNSQGKVIYALVNTERNLHMLEQMPHRTLLDLSVIYRFVIETPEGIDSAIINWALAEELGFASEEALYEAACSNTPVLFPKLIAGVDCSLCMIGNQKGILGAAAILYDGVLDEIAARFGSDLYLIPSSIHEMLAVSAGDYDGEGLRKSIYSINRTVVEEKDVLSDHLYFYSRAEKRLTISGRERIVS